jgi:hypothetical protein
MKFLPEKIPLKMSPKQTSKLSDHIAKTEVSLIAHGVLLCGMLAIQFLFANTEEEFEQELMK